MIGTGTVSSSPCPLSWAIKGNEKFFDSGDMFYAVSGKIKCSIIQYDTTAPNTDFAYYYTEAVLSYCDSLTFAGGLARRNITTVLDTAINALTANSVLVGDMPRIVLGNNPGVLPEFRILKNTNPLSIYGAGNNAAWACQTVTELVFHRWSPIP